jgi:hypothetical protein
MPRLDLAEVGYDDTPAWTPIPTWSIRALAQRDPSLGIDFSFPEVFKEDRPALLKDLETAEVLGVTTHRRMAERIAKEIGVEDYDYDAEQDDIAKEKKVLPPDERTAARDLLIPSKAGEPVGGGAPMAPALAGPNGHAGTGHPEPSGSMKRGALSDDARAAFDRTQKQSEAVSHALTDIAQTLATLRESVSTLTERIRALETAR